MPVEAKPLFRLDVLRPSLASFVMPEQVAAARPKLQKWAEMLASGRADSIKEHEILADFLTDIFCTLLGYTRAVDNAVRFTISREKHIQVDGKYADAVLGDFRPGKGTFTVAIEGKGPKDPLDRPFAGRHMSAVDQAYRYAINLPCDWVIVTSIRETRLYYKGADQHTFERFDTVAVAADDALLKKLVFLLGEERVVPVDGRCHLYDLLTASEKVGRELTKEFYVRYADMREGAFERLCEANPQVQPPMVLNATQKLLDRILFCSFCEDRGLLPADTVRKAYEHTDPYNPRPVSDNFRGLFRAVNKGNPALSIPAYNGGLFADDQLLDVLTVPDEVCRYFEDLASYDYRPAADISEDGTAAKRIDVDILGHIFEQSITDLERLRNELEGLAERVGKEAHGTRRKKEGAFYTPAFITRYLVKQALGGVLKDRFEELRQRHEHESGGTTRQVLARPAVYDLERLNRPQRAALVRFWEDWQEQLAGIRLVDPACGSGAFLIEAFDQLHAAYESSNDRLAELRSYRTLFDLDRHILQNNLYGVDLNEEAVQICRLSLWIKTAQRGKPLTSLDHTIRVGNSVVQDPVVHAKAFDWHGAFSEVFEHGGFDVVVSNPPYIRQEWLTRYKEYWEGRFKTYHGVADIFTYFYELGMELLRPGGRLGFITSGSWVRGNYGAPLRAYLLQNAAIESMVDFGEYQPFEDAEMIRPTIAVLRKGPGDGVMRLFKWLTKGKPPEQLSEVIASAPTMQTKQLGARAWELEQDAVITLRKKLTSTRRALKQYAGGSLYRGVLTGLTDVFIIKEGRRQALIAADPRSGELIKPFIQGTHLRPWYIEPSGEYLLAIKSSRDFAWPWSEAGDNAERVFAETYPAVHAYLHEHWERAERRQDKGRFWWELRSCAYWDVFDRDKIVWPDISKLPRFSMDSRKQYLGNTGYFIACGDYYLLGVLSSWTTWFFISKTNQPLRLRGNRWQYRLFSQFMEHIPIPEAATDDRDAIAELARRCSALGEERYKLESHVRQRLCKAFGQDAAGQPTGVLNTKAESWWEVSINELGTALKASFKLPSNPLGNPRVADEWEPYLTEKCAEVAKLQRALADAETELNDRVYRLYELSTQEVKLLQQEVEH